MCGFWKRSRREGRREEEVVRGSRKAPPWMWRMLYCLMGEGEVLGKGRMGWGGRGVRVWRVRVLKEVQGG